jgi:hypothetical protein
MPRLRLFGPDRPAGPWQGTEVADLTLSVPADNFEVMALQQAADE